MEQLTEFVSKSFTADRDRLSLISSTSATNTSTYNSISSSAMATTGVSTFLSLSSTPSTLSFPSLPLFRTPHPNYSSRSTLHSVVERLNGIGPLSGLPLFNPAFHTSSPLTTLSNSGNSSNEPQTCSSPSKLPLRETPSRNSVTSNCSEHDVTSIVDTEEDNSTRESGGKDLTFVLILVSVQ